MLQDLNLASCTKMDINATVNVLVKLLSLKKLSLAGWEMAELPEGHKLRVILIRTNCSPPSAARRLWAAGQPQGPQPVVLQNAEVPS